MPKFNKKYPGGIEEARDFYQQAIDAAHPLKVEEVRKNSPSQQPWQLTQQLLMETIDASDAEKQVLAEYAGTKSKLDALWTVCSYGIEQESHRFHAQTSFFQLFSLLLEALSSCVKMFFALLQVGVRSIGAVLDGIHQELNSWIKTDSWYAVGLGNLAKLFLAIPRQISNRLANVIGYAGNLVDGLVKLAGSPLRFLKVWEAALPWTKSGTLEDAFSELVSDFAANGLGRVGKNALRLAPEAAIAAAWTIPIFQPIAAAGSIAASYIGTSPLMATTLNATWQGLLYMLPWVNSLYDRYSNRAINAVAYEFKEKNGGDPKEGALRQYKNNDEDFLAEAAAKKKAISQAKSDLTGVSSEEDDEESTSEDADSVFNTIVYPKRNFKTTNVYGHVASIHGMPKGWHNAEANGDRLNYIVKNENIDPENTTADNEAPEVFSEAEPKNSLRKFRVRKNPKEDTFESIYDIPEGYTVVSPQQAKALRAQVRRENLYAVDPNRFFLAKRVVTSSAERRAEDREFSIIEKIAAEEFAADEVPESSNPEPEYNFPKMEGIKKYWKAEMERREQEKQGTDSGYRPSH